MTAEDRSVFWRPPVAGVELLHAYFRRHVYARHAHEGMTLALVDRGVAAFECGGRDHRAPAGTAFLIRPGETHTGRAADAAGYRYRVLYLAPATLDRLLDGTLPAARLGSGVVRDPALLRALSRTHAALTGQVAALARDSALHAVGASLAALPGGQVTAPARGGPPTGAVRLARDYLRAQPEREVPLEQLAAVCGVGVHHLIRSFTAALGMPPHAYQTQLRVWRARSLLADGLPPVEVAPRVGFYDQAHLTRVFKRYTGVTPGQFQG
ncbi:AraC family transcriptional regulator [Streptacidiphilus sp. P02-A3a]|uniref:AraC family transcriptional regulator n=1 Tax=Streptacidiphilus sp. P02-A3a TaxID=2704468 RepID=UPI0015F87253|nr:AraC family transcriptional regulator [Streptacidiphilus sp. P02-A3a]QMU70610.1 AraC family transcriptional regulator [Streptacidiphilus sp. P02-A3a]